LKKACYRWRFELTLQEPSLIEIAELEKKIMKQHDVDLIKFEPTSLTVWLFR
jgi:hypothetical protein